MCWRVSSEARRPLRAADSETEPEAFARIIVDAASCARGQGSVIASSTWRIAGKRLAVDGRPSTGFWLRVLLRDGRAAYVLGDEVQPFAVTPGEKGAPSRPGLFAPPPWSVRVGACLGGGLLSIPRRPGGVQPPRLRRGAPFAGPCTKPSPWRLHRRRTDERRSEAPSTGAGSRSTSPRTGWCVHSSAFSRRGECLQSRLVYPQA